DIRQADHNLTIEAPRAQQRRIKHVGTVGGRDDDDTIVRLKTIHLYQQLVERLLALVVTTAQPGTTVTADGVDLINEDDARRMLFSLLEHVAHTAGADTDKHLHKVRTGNGEERHLGLTRHGLGQQRLTGTRRAYHQHATRNTPTQALEFARIAQKLHQLADFFLGLV